MAWSTWWFLANPAALACNPGVSIRVRSHPNTLPRDTSTLLVLPSNASTTPNKPLFLLLPLLLVVVVVEPCDGCCCCCCWLLLLLPAAAVDDDSATESAAKRLCTSCVLPAPDRPMRRIFTFSPRGDKGPYNTQKHATDSACFSWYGVIAQGGISVIYSTYGWCHPPGAARL